MKKNLIISIILIIIVGGGAFFGGMQYQKSQRPSFSGFGGSRSGRFGQTGTNANSKAVRGEILSSDSSSITVKMMDGSSKIILISNTTSIMQATTAAKEALQKGKQVTVFGNQNSDGSVTAQNISIGSMPRPTN